jgi:hypothetical protein
MDSGKISVNRKWVTALATWYAVFSAILDEPEPGETLERRDERMRILRARIDREMEGGPGAPIETLQ